MSSETEAENFINSIKQEFNLEGHEHLRTILTESLKILSEELYDTSTHFLREFLQNADDNSYDCPDPTLVLTYKRGIPRGSLRVDSNETGFTASNIKAICSIRQSTKLGRKGYIGEKGIGFKSVFKIADVVWISSNKFSFKFDKSEPFGLIAPTWAEFPEQTRLHQTSFFLQLSQDSDTDTLIHDLVHFDPSFILFLRQIKEIVLHIEQHDGSIDKFINRKDERSDSFEIRTLTTSNSIQKYIFMNYEVTDLPRDRKRPDYTTSEIALAFPIIEPSSKPQLGIQNVFSSLPISSYGLRFLLQGDFRLTANRLHIDVSSAWNCALRDALPQSFVQAIKTLISTEETKYTWPYFVPDTDIAPFFQPSRIAIIEVLKQTELLESFAGNCAKPPLLFFVNPTKFCDEDRVPFTHTAQNSIRYLSFKYPIWTINSLLSLGMRKMTNKEFVEDLGFMLQTDAQSFHNRPQNWHSQLSRALIRVCENRALRKQLSKLALIPLSNGKWSSAEAGPLIFSVDLDLDLATSLSTFFDFVDKSALVDTDRIELMRRLGAKEMDKREICRYIVHAHASKNVRPKEWTREQLVLHTAFLVEQRWETPDPIDLWFATSDDERCKGSKLYVYDNPKDDPATRHIFEKLQQRFPMLHKDYLDQLKDDNPLSSGFRASLKSRVSTSALSKMPTHDIDKGESSVPERGELSKNLALDDSQSQDGMSDTFQNRQIIYLRDTLHLSTIPRLVVSNQTDPTAEFNLSEEFKFILSECLISDVFQILNDNWSYYSKWLGSESLNDQSNSDDKGGLRITTKNATKTTRRDAYHYHEVLFEKSRNKLIKAIGDTEIKLESGCFALGETFLPNLDTVVDRYVELPSLKLHNANSKVMQERITRFGITVEANVHYYMTCLESIRKTHTTALPMVALSHIYDKIQSLYDDNKDIYNLFWTKPLIYSTAVSNTTGVLFGWITSQACILHEIDIISEYPRCTYLLKSLITTEYKELTSNIDKATEIKGSWTRKEIVQVLRLINNGLEGMDGQRPARLVQCLSSLDIFPVIYNRHMSQQRVKVGYDKLLSVQNKAWYIPDRPGFEDGFSGILPLLAFDLKEVQTIELLLAALHLDSRRLSRLTKPSTTLVGASKYCPEHTKFCKQRVRFLKQLIPDMAKNRNMLLKQIKWIRVNHVTEILKGYTMIRNNEEVHSRPEKVSDDAEWKDHLQLHMTRENHTESLSLSYEMISLISEGCKITDSTSLNMLYMAFGERDLGIIAKRFRNYNLESWYSGEELTYQDKTSTFNPVGISPSIPSHSRDSDNGGGSGGSRAPDVIRVDFSRNEAAQKPTDNQNELFSRCAPMLIRDTHYVENFKEVRWQENILLQYLGEHMVSKFFSEKLGALYNPSRNWANYIGSSTRSLAQWAPAPTAAFSFTGTAASKKITEILYELGNPRTDHRKRTSTNYRFEITVSPSNTESYFTISPQQFIRIQPHHSRNVGTSSVEQVTVLMCVRDVYKESNAIIYIDPWQQVTSGHIGLSSSSTLNVCTKKPLYHAPRFQFSAPVVENQALQAVEESQVANGIRDMVDQFIGRTIGGTRLPRIGRVNNGGSPDIPHLTRGERTIPISLNQQRHNFWPYEYKNLEHNHFRLLRIYPGAKNDQLQGLVFTWPLNEYIRYNALSYVWGKESQLTCTLFTAEGHIMIPQSTHEALKKVRREEDAITVWIDAICINQENSQEKARQIPLLPNIFQKAWSTIALVALDNESDAAVTLLRQIYTQHSPKPERRFWSRDVPHLPSTWRDRLIPPNGDPIWEQLVDFFNRPWFRRAWIVQEVILSWRVELVCGEKLIPWTVIEQAMDIINHNVDPMTINMAVWDPFRRLSEHRASEHKQCRWCLFHLLESYRHVQSTLMRDRFFALIGLAGDANIQEFEPDYEKSTRLEDIVCRFAKVFVEQGRGIALLHRAGLDTEPSRFPSWVPNWTVPKQSGLYNFHHSRGVEFNASRGESEQIECQSDNRTLTADGYIFDSIKKMGTKTISIKSLDDFFREVDAMVENLNPSIPDTEQARIKWQVPIAGPLGPKIAAHNVFLEDSYYQLRKALELIRNKSAKEQDEMLQAIQKVATTPILIDQETNLWYKTRAYTSLLINDLEGWKFIITQRNYCGIAPSRAECGDQVSIICGGAVPFLIRGSETTGFRLVGEVYVDGMMHGEALGLDSVAKTAITMY